MTWRLWRWAILLAIFVTLAIIFGATIARAGIALFGMFGLVVLIFFSIKDRRDARRQRKQERQ